MQRYSRIASYNLSIATNPRKNITMQQNCVLLQLQARTAIQEQLLTFWAVAKAWDRLAATSNTWQSKALSSSSLRLQASRPQSPMLGTANLETCQHLPDAAPFTSERSCGLHMVVEAVLQQSPVIFRFICSERSAPLLLCVVTLQVWPAGHTLKSSFLLQNSFVTTEGPALHEWALPEKVQEQPSMYAAPPSSWVHKSTSIRGLIREQDFLHRYMNTPVLTHLDMTILQIYFVIWG